jgi:DNA-directed RNA polymerase alpha subunit
MGSKQSNATRQVLSAINTMNWAIIDAILTPRSRRWYRQAQAKFEKRIAKQRAKHQANANVR